MAMNKTFRFCDAAALANTSGAPARKLRRDCILDIVYRVRYTHLRLVVPDFYISRMTYRFSNFILNSTPLTLEREGKLVALPPKALEILLLLLQQEGRVISKEEIFRQIWPDTHVVESSLTKNISMLRKAIDEPAQASLIENLAKRGYRFTLNQEQPSALLVRSYRRWTSYGLAAAGVILISVWAARSLQPKASTLSEADIQIMIGRHHWNRVQPDEIQKALKRFEQAVAANPKSALAYAGIADSNLMLASFGFGDAFKLIAAARVASARAIELDPKLASGHGSAAMAAIADFDWDTANRELKNRL